MYAPTLVFLLCLFAAAAPVFAQEATVTDSVELEVGQLSGTALLDITDAEVILEWHQNVYLTGSPGDPAEVYFEGDAQDGGRLQYTVQDAGSVKIVVATADTIADGALTVEATECGGGCEGTCGQPQGAVPVGSQPQDLITGIGNCTTGDLAGDGYLVHYVLDKPPETDSEEVVVEYELVSE